MTENLKRGRPYKKHGWALRSSAGFTMIEMMMALAILSIAFGTIYKSFEHLNRSTTKENVRAGTQQAVRIAVDFMVQDIRLAGLNPLGSSDIGIQAISPESIHFTMDANFDGDDADTFEDITYTYYSADGTLKQTNHLGADETLIDNITDLNFIYLTSAGQTLDPTDQSAANRAEIRSVIISLTMQRPAGRDEVSRTYTTRVRCRNL